MATRSRHVTALHSILPGGGRRPSPEVTRSKWASRRRTRQQLRACVCACTDVTLELWRPPAAYLPTTPGVGSRDTPGVATYNLTPCRRIKCRPTVAPSASHSLVSGSPEAEDIFSVMSAAGKIDIDVTHHVTERPMTYKAIIKRNSPPKNCPPLMT